MDLINNKHDGFFDELLSVLFSSLSSLFLCILLPVFFSILKCHSCWFALFHVEMMVSAHASFLLVRSMQHMLPHYPILTAALAIVHNNTSLVCWITTMSINYHAFAQPPLKAQYHHHHRRGAHRLLGRPCVRSTAGASAEAA